MNYFFFLNNINTNLSSSIDIFNMPPMKSFYKNKLKYKYVKIFYVKNSKWEVIHYDDIQPNEIKTYYNTNLIKEFGDYSFFIGLFDKNQKLFDKNTYMLSQPTWRSNIAIRSKYSSASYQGEIPDSICKKKISLVSCNPMTQSSDNIKSYFYLINLYEEPIQEVFTVNIINKKKKIIGQLECFTNKINYFDISNYMKENDILIFQSSIHGGIPIYFNFSDDYKHLSLEHTHPPVEYVYGGNRLNIQKKKKEYWFKI